MEGQEEKMKTRYMNLLGGLLAGALLLLGPSAAATDEAADAMINQLTTEVLAQIKADKSLRNGELARIVALVDERIMPHVNFRRMTASAVGPGWRRASPEQQKRLQDEFKILLVRTYAGALSQVSDQTTVAMKPMRAAADDREVVVRSEIRTGHGDPVQLDYRLEKTPGEGRGWRIYNLNVMGVWLVETYRSQFAQEINAKGIDGLIGTLVERNKANEKKG